MAIFEKGNDVQFAPKVGENITVVVKSMRKVEQDDFPERNLKSRDGKNHGYYYSLTLDNGKEMPINAWSLYFAFQESGVDFGDTININHVGTGKYEVAKVAPKGKVVPADEHKETWED